MRIASQEYSVGWGKMGAKSTGATLIDYSIISVMIKTSSLLAKVKTSAMLPPSLPEGTNDIILDAVNHCVQTEIVPALLDNAWSGLVVAKEVENGLLEFPIPERAIGERLEGVYVRSQGNASSQTQYTPMLGYTQGNSVVSFNSLSNDFAVKYYLRLPSLVEDEYVVESVAGGVIGLSAAFTGTEVDILDSNGKLIEASVSVLSGSGTTTLTIDSTSAVEGGYVAEPETASALPLPFDLQAVLVDVAVATLLDSWGDKEDAQNRRERALRSLERLVTIISPPVATQPATMAPGPHFRGIRGF